MESNENQVASWQWVISGIIVIGLIALGVYFFTGSSNTSNSPTETPTTTVNTNEVNRLVVSDQFPGNIVYITTVQLSRPGFVTITKDVAGKPGAAIGTQSFDKGINTGKVNLTEKTVDGKVYHAVLYYNESKDKILLDKTFKARSDLPEDKG